MAKGNRTLETLEINGGVLCLNFINTVSSLPKFEHDYLGNYSALAGWGEKIGIYSAKQSSRLQKQAKEEAVEAEKALQEIKAFRELLYRVFANLIKRTDPDEGDMAAFIQFCGMAVSNGRFVKRDNFYTMDWAIDQTYNAILRPIAYSAGQLLLSKELIRVKACDGCGWLFLDTSKNQSRRWCSMDACGVSDKMRRYYRRSQMK